jgi:L-glyceraldehyde 3-phosphate reductase
VGISKYPPEKAEQAMKILKEQHVPCLIFQDKYSMLHRVPEKTIFEVVQKNGSGFIGFSPLAQGILSDKYLNGIPAESRAANPDGFLRKEQITQELVAIVKQLNAIAKKRNQSLTQMALAWALRKEIVTSLIVGTRSIKQLDDNLKAIDNLKFSEDELRRIDSILSSFVL